MARPRLRDVASRLLQHLPPRRWPALLQTVLAQAPEHEKLKQGVLTMWGSIENLARNGFRPAAVIDAGAWIGEWTEHVRPIFPDASFLMLDANPVNEPRLAAAAKKLGPKVRHRIALLGREARPAIDFYSMETGSSVLVELTTFPREKVSLPMRTLDEVVREEGLSGRLFLKADVQGYELELLRGARGTLAQTEVVLLEVSLLPYNAGAPLIDEVIAFMKQEGFAVYDACGGSRRESDAALFQLDLMFAREDSALRGKKTFFAKEPKRPEPEPREPEPA